MSTSTKPESRVNIPYTVLAEDFVAKHAALHFSRDVLIDGELRDCGLQSVSESGASVGLQLSVLSRLNNCTIEASNVRIEGVCESCVITADLIEISPHASTAGTVFNATRGVRMLRREQLAPDGGNQDDERHQQPSAQPTTPNASDDVQAGHVRRRPDLSVASAR